MTNKELLQKMQEDIEAMPIEKSTAIMECALRITREVMTFGVAGRLALQYLHMIQLVARESAMEDLNKKMSATKN